MNANVPPGRSQRRASARNAGRRARSTWLSQKPANRASTAPVRLGPRVADVDVGAQPVREQPVAGAIERRLGRVVDRQLALAGEQRRPPAGAGRELDDLPRNRQTRRASGQRRRARRSRPCRGSGHERSGRGAGTSRRIRARGPRSTRPGRRPAVAALGDRRTRAAPGPGRAARPRSVIASRSRNRRKPLSPALPTQVGQSCAQPSRSSGPRHVCAVPHHRQSNVARNGTAPDQASDRRPAAGRGDVDERLGVDDLGQELDAVDDPRPRPAEVGRAVDREHRAAADGRQLGRTSPGAGSAPTR